MSLSFIFLTSGNVCCFRKLHRRNLSDPATRVTVFTNRKLHNHGDHKSDAIFSTIVGNKIFKDNIEIKCSI